MSHNTHAKIQYLEHQLYHKKAIEIISDEVIINSEQDALDLMANIDYQFDSKIIILKEKNLNVDFFDLKTGVAGAILQKFSNYRVQLAIIGDFSKYSSKSLQDFIYESNKQKRILFVEDIEMALNSLG